jgi:hypothetical protein
LKNKKKKIKIKKIMKYTWNFVFPMSLKEVNINEKQEDLSLVVEPLIEAVSELVMSAVTSKLDNVMEICEAIANKTQVVVAVAAQVSNSIDNVDQQDKLAEGL